MDNEKMRELLHKLRKRRFAPELISDEIKKFLRQENISPEALSADELIRFGIRQQFIKKIDNVFYVDLLV